MSLSLAGQRGLKLAEHVAWPLRARGVPPRAALPVALEVVAVGT
jgi:hypothetical protein